MKKKTKVILCGMAVLPFLLCGGWYYKNFGEYANKRDAELARSKTLGIPTDVKELEPLLPSKEDNAALYYQQISKNLKAPEMAAATKDITTGTYSLAKPEEKAKVAPALDKLEPILQDIVKQSKHKNCAYPRDWSLGPSMLFPEYADHKQFVRLLGARAESQAKAGNVSGAFQSLQASPRISRHAGSDPTLIGKLVQIACEAITLSDTEKVLKFIPVDSISAAGIKELLQDLGPVPNFVHALKGEVVYGRIAITQIGSSGLAKLSGTSPDPMTTFADSLAKLKGVRDAFDYKLLKCYNDYIPQYPDNPEEFLKGVEVSQRLQTAVQGDTSIANLFNLILIPVFAQANEAVGGSVMVRHLLATTAYLEEQKLSTGKWPTALPKKRWATDPWDEKPLRYSLVGSGFKLYSIRRDKIDNGGNPRGPGKRNDETDEVIEVKG